MALQFSFKGTIGKRNFILWSIIYIAVLAAVVIYTSYIITYATLVVYVVLNLNLVIKRLRSDKYPLWLSLLYLIPGPNIVLFLVLILKKDRSIDSPNIQSNKRTAEIQVASFEEIQRNVYKILEESCK